MQPEDQAPAAFGTENMFAGFFAALDGAVAHLLVGRWWFLRVGAMAVLLGLLTHTPHYSLYFGRAGRWYSPVFQQQVEHPLTPVDPWKYLPPADPGEGIASHLDKLAFRLTVPVLGKIFRTGIYSWPLFSRLAGLAFYPLLAGVAGKWLQDRRTTAYLTMAFALLDGRAVLQRLLCVRRRRRVVPAPVVRGERLARGHLFVRAGRGVHG